MRNSFRLLVLFFFLISGVSISNAALVNGNFETDLSGWSLNNSPTVIQESSNHYVQLDRYEGIYQDISTTIGQSYTITFIARSLSTGSNDTGLQVAIGQLLFDPNVFTPSSSWTPYSFTFVADSPLTTIDFTGYRGTVGVDDVAVVPIPAAALLLGTGLVGLVVIRRRKQV